MENEIKLSGQVIAESRATGTEEDPIITRIRPRYTDKDKKVHIALLETAMACITGADGRRLDRVIEELQNAVGLIGGVILLQMPCNNLLKIQ